MRLATGGYESDKPVDPRLIAFFTEVRRLAQLIREQESQTATATEVVEAPIVRTTKPHKSKKLPLTTEADCRPLKKEISIYG